ncbi:MAG: phosphoribosylformylglycinamidine synthase subunit PurL, partial [Bdellovibrio sp.]
MNLQQRLKHYRLSEQEYELICKKLGRSPQGVEWAIFSALWSEHCSYKSSRVHLKKFSFSSPYVLESFGENAGVIDLGQGERIAFKMESHNHPSFIEPYEGAATGVGGILRDIFTMGARPLALANYLCFGSPEKMAPWLDGVVRGIGGYGNCVGVPTVTGQTEFHSSYDKNILVNAFALGYFGKNQPVFTSQARGVGNYVVYVGAKTGRDGVHGASMASESFDDKSEEKKPTIQKGDPFYEKLLIEACLEVMSQNWVEAIQDMGAAGLTSSSFEMASKGRVGLSLHLDKVPLRDPHMTPEDILLSESQERMLLICQPQNFKALSEVFFKWDLDAVIIGEVQENETVDLYWRGELLTSLSPKWVVDEAPLYERPYKKPPQKRAPFSKLEVEDELKTLFSMLKSAQGSGRQWVYRQFDQRVGGRTVFAGGEPVAVLCLPESKRYLGIVLGCRPYLMRWDVEVGAKDAIFYPALCLAVKGMRPLAVTDCLNFGNPEKEEIMGELVTSIEAMSEACQFLSTPVISGNVSLYNETLGKNITPTPAVGMVGLGEKMPPPSVFQSEGEQVFLVYKTF